MDALAVYVDGIGWWSPGIEDWGRAVAFLVDGTQPLATPLPKPAATLLPSAERRRAPEPVLLAADVAGQACAMAAHDPSTLPCVFASMHGDIQITDVLCGTLASAPLETSPFKFHNSVHNAPPGYWTVATACHAASSAVAAWHGSFAAGLFEAAVLAQAESRPVLFAAYDIAARGPLVDVIDSRTPFGVAFVLNPCATEKSRATLALRIAPIVATPAALPAHLTELAAANVIAANALPLLLALARGSAAKVELVNGAATALAIEVAR